jgi:phytol kinase
VREVLAVGAASVVFVSVLVIAEAATRRWDIDPEVSRRLVHLSSGVLAAGLPLVMSFPAIVVLALLFIPFMVASRRMGLFPAVHGVERATWGEAYFPLGVLLAAVLFPRSTPYAYGVLVMGVSDPFAGFAGQRYGRRAYRVLSAHKTYLGSSVFFLSTLALTLGTVAVAHGPSARSIAVVPLLAAALTTVEGLSGGGLDNVLLPAAAAGLLSLAL